MFSSVGSGAWKRRRGGFPGTELDAVKSSSYLQLWYSARKALRLTNVRNVDVPETSCSGRVWYDLILFGLLVLYPIFQPEQHEPRFIRSFADQAARARGIF
jgi:hypothetical protein